MAAPQPWQLFKAMQRHDVSNIDPDKVYDEVRELWSNGYFICTVYRDIVNGFLRLTVETADRSDLTWDQLMWVKRQLGRGNRWCVEMYPDDREVVAVGRALRHLWIVDGPPESAWTDERERAALAANPEFRAKAERIMADLAPEEP
jgi:hypothetical protein